MTNIIADNGLSPVSGQLLFEPMLNWIHSGRLQWNFNQNTMSFIYEDVIFSAKCQPISGLSVLTHWGRVTHICVSILIIVGSDNGLSPDWCQAIIWTNAGILLIGPLGTNFGEILFAIYKFSFKKMHLKMLSGKWLPSCLGLNVLIIESWIRQVIPIAWFAFLIPAYTVMWF